MTAILRLDNLSKAFGAVTVADALNFELAEGEALGVIGPNGAGKTSMFNLITGTLRPDSGRVQFAGRDITALGSAARSRSGMARTRHGNDRQKAARFDVERDGKCRKVGIVIRTDRGNVGSRTRDGSCAIREWILHLGYLFVWFESVTFPAEAKQSLGH